MDSYTKEPISIFFSDKEVMYNPESNKLTHWVKIKDEMVTEEEENEFLFSDNDWVLEDNGQ
jgi:hypothetical protein